MATEALRARPMLRTVFGKTLWEQRRAIAGWAIGLFAAGAMYAPFYPSIRENARTFDRYLESMPEFFREAFLGRTGDFTSPAGYLNTELFSFFAPLLFLLFAIGAGAKAVAGEEEHKTLDILLATPIPRRRVVVEKFLAMLAGGAGLALMLWLAVPLTGPPFDLRVDLGNLTAAVVMCYLLAMAFGAIALAVGAATGRRGLAIGVTGGIAAASWLVDLLAPAADATEWLQYLSPMHYYLDAEPMLRGLGVAGSLVLAGIALAGFLAALALFERRDLAA
jgi:ABC-2 type transport system permease protein